MLQVLCHDINELARFALCCYTDSAAATDKMLVKHSLVLVGNMWVWRVLMQVAGVQASPGSSGWAVAMSPSWE